MLHKTEYHYIRKNTSIIQKTKQKPSNIYTGFFMWLVDWFSYVRNKNLGETLIIQIFKVKKKTSTMILSKCQNIAKKPQS